MLIQKIDYIFGTDKTFTLIIRNKQTGEPKDLSAFVGSSTGLNLNLDGEDETIGLTLESSANGQLAVTSVASGLAGKIEVVFTKNIPLRQRINSNMELTIVETVNRNTEHTSIVQFEDSLNVISKLFE